jgi:hypothetical protein
MFQKKYFRISKRVYKNVDDFNYANYECIIVGSDQVWNPEISGSIDPVFGLNFNNKKIKKISYAASFSANHINEEQKNILITLLQDFDSISVREKQLENYLKTYLSQNIFTVSDPTFLLTKEEWKQFITPPKINQKYILIYQARGDKNKLLDMIKPISKKYNLKVIDASGLNYRVKLGDMQHVNPFEFLGLIMYAEFILTVSFHGTALPIILEKPFFSVVLNDGRDDRVINLLSEVNLESRILNLGDKISNYEIDYEPLRSKINQLRRNSLDYLQNSLK